MGLQAFAALTLYVVAVLPLLVLNWQCRIVSDEGDLVYHVHVCPITRSMSQAMCFFIMCLLSPNTRPMGLLLLLIVLNFWHDFVGDMCIFAQNLFSVYLSILSKGNSAYWLAESVCRNLILCNFLACKEELWEASFKGSLACLLFGPFASSSFHFQFL